MTDSSLTENCLLAVPMAEYHAVGPAGHHIESFNLLLTDGINTIMGVFGRLHILTLKTPRPFGEKNIIEVHVRIDAGRLAARELTVGQVVNALREQNENISAGTRSQGKRDFTVRTVGQYTSEEEILNTVVADTPGGPVYVRDVATVKLDFREPISFVRSKGQFVLAFPVRRETGSLVAAWGAMLLEHARAGVRLIVPDAGRETARVVRLVESCGQGETLRAAGGRFTLPELLAAADLVAYLPTGDAPLSGVAWAMAAGRPIVAADVPVIRELLTHGRTAWLCRPGDPKEACRQMLSALERREQSSRQVEAAQAQANAAFGRRRLVEQYRRVYENLLADRLVGSGLDDVALVS